MVFSQKKVIGLLLIIISLLTITIVVLNFLIDRTPPKIVGEPAYDPTPTINSTITIAVFVEDRSGIKSCNLVYRVNNSDWLVKEMRLYAILCCPPRYLTRIGPFYKVGTIVDFYFEVTDKCDNTLATTVYQLVIVDKKDI